MRHTGVWRSGKNFHEAMSSFSMSAKQALEKGGCQPIRRAPCCKFHLRSWPSRFFRLEYQLDHLISQLRKPHVSFMDGITFGGGVGLSAHGTFRIATERYDVALQRMLFIGLRSGWRQLLTCNFLVLAA
jgi:enoyl-CoA hydratase/carnithine racemase